MNRVPIATWNPERDLWETSQMDLFSGLSDVFSETWPTSGMMLDGRVYELPMSERLIREKECSLLPTPAARDWKGTDSPGNWRRNTPDLTAVSVYFPLWISGETTRPQSVGGNTSWDVKHPHQPHSAPTENHNSRPRLWSG